MKLKILLLPAILVAFSAAAFAQRSNLVSTAFQPSAGPSQAIQPDRSELPNAAASLERRAFDAINARRVEKGLSALIWSDQIAEVARHHSENMAKNNFFSHQDPDSLLVDDRANQAGVTGWTAIGENIAFVMSLRDPTEIAIENWMHSNAHRENLLSNRWRKSAIGVAITADGKYYFTQVFID